MDKLDYEKSVPMRKSLMNGRKSFFPNKNMLAETRLAVLLPIPCRKRQGAISA